MKVILMQDVKNLGKKGEVKEVSDGYARNFLFVKKLAVEANKSTMSELKHQQISYEKRMENELAEAKKLAEDIEKKVLTIIAKSGDGGKLFGAITSKEISNKLKEEFNLNIDKKKIETNGGLKVLGMHQVLIKLYHGVDVKLKVNILDKA